MRDFAKSHEATNDFSRTAILLTKKHTTTALFQPCEVFKTTNIEKIYSNCSCFFNRVTLGFL